MKGGQISDNEGRWGGGICIWDSTFIMSGGIISGNKSISGGGGGIDIEAGGTFTKAAVGGSNISGIIYGATAGIGLANTAGSGGGAAINGYSIGKKVDRTLGEYDEISTLNPGVNWE
jgi:hypothetical protein